MTAVKAIRNRALDILSPDFVAGELREMCERRPGRVWSTGDVLDAACREIEYQMGLARYSGRESFEEEAGVRVLRFLRNHPNCRKVSGARRARAWVYLPDDELEEVEAREMVEGAQREALLAALATLGVDGAEVQTDIKGQSCIRCNTEAMVGALTGLAKQKAAEVESLPMFRPAAPTGWTACKQCGVSVPSKEITDGRCSYCSGDE